MPINLKEKYLMIKNFYKIKKMLEKYVNLKKNENRFMAITSLRITDFNRMYCDGKIHFEILKEDEKLNQFNIDSTILNKNLDSIIRFDDERNDLDFEYKTTTNK